MKRALFAAAVIAVVAAGLWMIFARRGDAADTYRFVTVTRGDVIATVSCTGNLEATQTVEVGTQVSGQIAEIYVDFNDRVEKGQLLARIDPTLLQQEIRSAEANLERSRAELDQARRELERNRPLQEQQLITERDWNTLQYQLDVATASYKSAEIGLERARRNLAYSEIRAPIDGVVLGRLVDVGQTVAASLSAPQLFLIAGDLSKMQILASVDESDIGKVFVGQEARFTVQAHGDRVFTGRVSQIRLQSTMTENVVSYTVVIELENPDNVLLPGMTATVELVVDKATGVLKVPNAALRFQPTAEMRAQVSNRGDGAGDNGSPRGDAASNRAGGSREGSGAGRSGENGGTRTGATGRGAEGVPAGGENRGAAPGANGDGAGRGGDRSVGRGMLWTVQGGRVEVIPVRTGITDGQNTVIEGEGVAEGLEAIAAVTSGSAGTVSNPFGGQQQSGSRFRGGF
jgi:HlyD family secretion protein